MISISMDQPQTTVVVPAHTHQTFICDLRISNAHKRVLTFQLAVGAQAYIYFLGIGVSADVEINVILEGMHAQAHVYGLYVLRDTQKINITTRQEHNSHTTTSSLIMYGLLNDAAQATYKG